MHNLSRTPARSRPRRRLRSLRVAALERLGRVHRADDGFLLIEVIISSLLIGLIVVATFTGFDVVNRASADQRAHDQAVLLAAQSQEQLRSDPAATLVALETTPHSYTRTANGTEYTITQESKPVAASGKSTGCSSTETTAQSGANFRITSSVTWKALGTRPPVTASSLITPPTGSALEVDVTNGETRPVSGVTAKASFVPVEGAGTTYEEGTTGAAGCVVLSGIPSTTATIEIPEITGYVTPNGLLKWPTVSKYAIAPNYTVHYPVSYDKGGKIEADFTYKGQTTYEREAGKVENVSGDTFVAYSAKLTAEPKFEVGSTRFEYEVGNEEHYKSAPLENAGYATNAFTATGAKYPNGDLFPWSKESWEVYAGDCAKNNPETVTAKEAEVVKPEAKVAVERGATKSVKVPMSYVRVNVYSGVEKEPKTLESTAYPVVITDTECEGTATPNNAKAANLRHTQLTSAEGHLTAPFQPFGNAKLCVYSASTKRTYTVAYDNTTVAGSKKNIYLGELSPTEKAEKRAAEKAAFETRKTKLETEIAKRQTEETNIKNERKAQEANKAAKETEEKNNIAKWEAEEKAKGGKKITAAERAAKEKTREKEKATREATEAANNTKWSNEEATLKARATTQANEKATLESEEKAASTKWTTEATEEAKAEDAIVSGGTC